MKMNLRKHVSIKCLFRNLILILTILFKAFAILKEMEAQKATEAARAKEEIKAASKSS